MADPARCKEVMEGDEKNFYDWKGCENIEGTPEEYPAKYF